MVGIGMSGFKPEVEDSVKEEIARQKMYEVSEEYSLGIEDVDVEFDPGLPYDVMGRTIDSGYRGDGVTVAVGESFFDANEAEQLKTMLHEGVHVKQFRNEVGDWLRSDIGTSREFAREVEKASRSSDISQIEGITEVITDNLLPFEAVTGYPYEKRRKAAELEAKGINLESELMQDIEEEISGIIEHYKEVDFSYEFGDLYVESGTFNGIDYTANMIGGYDQEQKVNEYLEGITGLDINRDYSAMLEPENSEYETSALS